MISITLVSTTHWADFSLNILKISKVSLKELNSTHFKCGQSCTVAIKPVSSIQNAPFQSNSQNANFQSHFFEHVQICVCLRVRVYVRARMCMRACVHVSVYDARHSKRFSVHESEPSIRTYLSMRPYVSFPTSVSMSENMSASIV